MTSENRNIRIALPSKGLLADASLQLFADIGLPIYSPNPRQYIARIPLLPQAEVIFQRPGDIVISVRDGSVDFGITGSDIYYEKNDHNGRILTLHSQLGYGKCTLNVIVPDEWTEVETLADLARIQAVVERPLRVGTKFPRLAEQFFAENTALPIQIIQAEGALEIAPTIGYADIIVDLVSTGTTLRDNRLKRLQDGTVLEAQACLLANKAALQNQPDTRAVAIQLLEMVGAYLRGKRKVAVFANVRASSEEEIAQKLLPKAVISGLQGPTVSRILTRDSEPFFSVHVVVEKELLHQAVRELRQIGGSGVVVSPVSYIFEEEPLELTQMLAALEE
jgi:ATP phosphoribosyltransferase